MRATTLAVISLPSVFKPLSLSRPAKGLWLIVDFGGNSCITHLGRSVGFVISKGNKNCF